MFILHSSLYLSSSMLDYLYRGRYNIESTTGLSFSPEHVVSSTPSVFFCPVTKSCNNIEKYFTGQCLNFNCAWVLVLMLRQTLTFLRSRGCTAFLPIDHHIYLHKLTGVLIAVYSLVHTIMHLVNFSK